MLYIQDPTGSYVLASKETVFAEARRLSSYQLRRGVIIESSLSASGAIGQKIGGYQQEMFACLFLDNKHRVLAFEEMFRGTINLQRGVACGFWSAIKHPLLTTAVLAFAGAAFFVSIAKRMPSSESKSTTI